jgi:hypothetical protein
VTGGSSSPHTSHSIGLTPTGHLLFLLQRLLATDKDLRLLGIRRGRGQLQAHYIQAQLLQSPGAVSSTAAAGGRAAATTGRAGWGREERSEGAEIGPAPAPAPR